MNDKEKQMLRGESLLQSFEMRGVIDSLLSRINPWRPQFNDMSNQ